MSDIKTAEDYLRDKYGSKLGSFSWREEEKAFNAGIESQTNVIAQLEAELEEYKNREQWIHDNAKTVGGGHGFTVTFFVPVDHEDIFCGISAAVKEQQ